MRLVGQCYSRRGIVGGWKLLVYTGGWCVHCTGKAFRSIPWRYGACPFFNPLAALHACYMFMERAHCQRYCVMSVVWNLKGPNSRKKNLLKFNYPVLMVKSNRKSLECTIFLSTKWVEIDLHGLSR